MATDGSKEATTAICAASHLLTATDREVHLLCVAPEVRAPKTGRIAAGTHQQRVAAETHRILRQAKQILAEEGIDAQIRCRTGSPANVILTEAREYDITVIGARGCNERSDVGLGPVASRLVEHATGCVLIGKELREDRGIRILVAVDGSASSQHALGVLNSFFDLESAEVNLLHVLETLWLPQDEELSENSAPASMETDQLLQELRREAVELLAEARARISEHHPGVTSSIREGIPGNEILSEADRGEYDLVVVGASGATDLKHSMLGSVSTKVAWNAACSVLVVRIPE